MQEGYQNRHKLRTKIVAGQMLRAWVCWGHQGDGSDRESENVFVRWGYRPTRRLNMAHKDIYIFTS